MAVGNSYAGGRGWVGWLCTLVTCRRVVYFDDLSLASWRASSAVAPKPLVPSGMVYS